MSFDMFLNIELQIQKTIDYFMNQGVLHFIKRFFGKLGFEHFSRPLIFLVLDLKDIPDDVKRPYSFHIATIEDIQNDQNYNDGFFTKAEAFYRIKRGYRLFVLRDKTRMVSFLWVEQKNAAVWWFNNLPVNMTKNMAYLSGAYTLPDFRGQGFYPKLKKEIFQYLRENGVNYIIEAVHPANTTALKIDTKLGFKMYQTIVYKRYWHIRLYIVQKFNSDERKRIITLFKAPKYFRNFFIDSTVER